MQSKNVDEMSDYIIDEMCGYFHNKSKILLLIICLMTKVTRSFRLSLMRMIISL